MKEGFRWLRTPQPQFFVATTAHLSTINNNCNAGPARCRKPTQFIDLEYGMQLSHEERQHQPMGEQRAQSFPQLSRGYGKTLERSDYASSNSSCSYTIREFGSRRGRGRGRGLFLRRLCLLQMRRRKQHQAGGTIRGRSESNQQLLVKAGSWHAL